MYKSKIFLLNKKNMAKKVKKSLQKIADIIQTTYGPIGKSVIISQSWEGNESSHLTKDGATVLNTLALKNKIERAVSKVAIDIGKRVLREEGDGTTTVTLLTNEIYKQILKERKITNFDGKSLLDTINTICQNIDKLSVPIDSANQLCQVAKIAANGNDEIGQAIGNLAFVLGKNGFISTEPSKNIGIVGEHRKGYLVGINNKEQIIAQHFLGNRNKIEIENAMVVLIDDNIEQIDQISKLLSLRGNGSQPIVLIGRSVSGSALQTLIVNHQQQGINIVAAKMPSDVLGGEWEDLKNLLDAPTVFSKTKGVPISKIDEFYKTQKAKNLSEVLGAAKKVTIYKDKIVFEPHNTDKANKIIGDLEKMLNETNPTVGEHAEISARISKLSQGIGVVYVGCTTDSEQERVLGAIDDAQRACFSAWRGGIVLGGLSSMLIAIHKSHTECQTTLENSVTHLIIHRAAAELLPMLYKHTIPDIKKRWEQVQVSDFLGEQESFLFDTATGQEIKNGWEIGIIEPANVLKTCLRAAATQAWELINLGAIVHLGKKEGN
jgi:chaperonin GroEL